MGNLHAGHLELIKEAQKISEHVVVTIFVNPLQFGPNEDFSRYPRTLSEDSEKLRTLNVPILFAPEIKDIYPEETNHTKVLVPCLSEDLCGKFRVGFFEGITTVVLKLFNIVQPDTAVFGEKDFQQLFIIRKMVNDLNLPIKIISVPTVREKDGLAMSSRNQYLNREERILAPKLYQALLGIQDGLQKGIEPKQLIADAIEFLRAEFNVDYLSIRNRNTLELPQENDKELILLAAAWLGKARLIDNISLNLHHPSVQECIR